MERVLLFNCQPDRNVENLLGPLAHTMRSSGRSFDYALFAPAQSVYSSVVPEASPKVDTSWQQQNCKLWNKLQAGHAAPQPTELGRSLGLTTLQRSLGECLDLCSLLLQCSGPLLWSFSRPVSLCPLVISALC